tara:strand:+ start:740 stop:1321 length:582 start_codon:yes stop_codon:yes gene_type:complete
MRIFISLIFIFLLLVTLVVLISKNPFIKIDESISKNEITESQNQKKLLDLTSLSERVSKKNIYLNLEEISREDFTSQLSNLSAFKKVVNFEESFIDIIPGDILNINLFGNNFQKEIKTVKKSNSNKVIRTISLDNENESFLVIGNELAFGKFHFDGKVFLLNKNESLTYLIDTSEADLEIPQFSEEDYSLKKK